MRGSAETVVDQAREDREDARRRVPDTDSGRQLGFGVPSAGDEEEAWRYGRLDDAEEEALGDQAPPATYCWSQEGDDSPEEDCCAEKEIGLEALS